MRGRRTLGATAALAAAVLTLVLAGPGRPEQPPAITVVVTRPTPAAPVTRARKPPSDPSGFSKREINQQDRPSPAQEREQQAAARLRPLLDHLPLTSNGVSVDIGGLAADDETTVITLSGREGPQARAEYRRLLTRYHDSGRAYAVQVIP